MRFCCKRYRHQRQFLNSLAFNFLCYIEMELATKNATCCTPLAPNYIRVINSQAAITHYKSNHLNHAKKFHKHKRASMQKI